MNQQQNIEVKNADSNDFFDQNLHRGKLIERFNKTLFHQRFFGQLRHGGEVRAEWEKMALEEVRSISRAAIQNLRIQESITKSENFKYFIKAIGGVHEEIVKNTLNQLVNMAVSINTQNESRMPDFDKLIKGVEESFEKGYIDQEEKEYKIKSIKNQRKGIDNLGETFFQKYQEELSKGFLQSIQTFTAKINSLQEIGVDKENFIDEVDKIFKTN